MHSPINYELVNGQVYQWACKRVSSVTVSYVIAERFEPTNQCRGLANGSTSFAHVPDWRTVQLANGSNHWWTVQIGERHRTYVCRTFYFLCNANKSTNSKSTGRLIMILIMENYYSLSTYLSFFRFSFLLKKIYCKYILGLFLSCWSCKLSVLSYFFFFF